MNLYDICNELEYFEFKVDEETGEILNFEELDKLNLEFNTKCENVIKYIKNLESDINELKEEKKNFEKRIKQKQNKSEFLQKFLTYAMNKRGLRKLDFVSGEARFRKSTPLEVFDEREFINWARNNNKDCYLKYEVKLVKDEIKNDLKNGEEIPFCRIIEKENLGIK